MAAKFVVKASPDGQFFFHLVSDDGKKLLASDMYPVKARVFDGIASIKMYARDASRYEKHVKDGKLYFTLKAANHEVIGVSDYYENDDLRDQALSKVIHSGSDAAIVEATAPKKSRAEVTQTLEARKLNKRTMRAMPGGDAVIRFGAVVLDLKEDDRRLVFEHSGEMYEADLARAKRSLRMIE
jgi:uncharacterized protein YegP (UPF0339 family)